MTSVRRCIGGLGGRSRRRRWRSVLGLCWVVRQASPTRQVAAELGVSPQMVCKWRRRFLVDRLDGLADEPRPGAPRKIADEQIEAGSRGHPGAPPGRCDALVAGVDGRTRPGYRDRRLGRIWKAFRLKPHLVDTFKISNDPQFIDKVRDVVGLYLDPPEKALVLCVDEKSPDPGFGPVRAGAADDARAARTAHPRLPAPWHHFAVRCPGCGHRPGVGSIHRRHRATEFKKFLAKLDGQIPAELDVHLICDNYCHPQDTGDRDNGLAPTRASTCTSPRPTPPGSTRSNAGSHCSPTNSSAAASTLDTRAGERHSRVDHQLERGPKTVRMDQNRR